jgi:hypothetical protein
MPAPSHESRRDTDTVAAAEVLASSAAAMLRGVRADLIALPAAPGERPLRVAGALDRGRAVLLERIDEVLRALRDVAPGTAVGPHGDAVARLMRIRELLDVLPGSIGVGRWPGRPQHS